MLAVSRALNPECEHIEADIRAVRLGRTFDAVFVHDAICHMTTEADLRAALETAIVHCETQLQNFVSSDESQRQSQQLDQHKASHAALLQEWEELAQNLEESD